LKVIRGIGSSLLGWGLLLLVMAWHVEGADAGGGGYAGLAVEGVGSGSGLGERSPGPGLRVLEVDPQGPAFEGGVVKGDILVKWDEQWLFTPVQLRGLLGVLPAGGRHRVLMRRGGEDVEVDLQIRGVEVREVEERVTRVVRVPHDAWAKGTAWVGQLEGLSVLPDEEAGEGREVSADVARVLSSWLEIEGNVPEWVVFLQDSGARESTNAVERVLPVPGAPVISMDGQGRMAVAGEDGVVEVRKRGGREYVLIRDSQGAVLYEGSMDGEQDAIFLRRLNPAMRRSAEELLSRGGRSDEPLEVELWRWSVPSRFL
jgi:hypothetical protein